MSEGGVSLEEVKKLRERLSREAAEGGYFLNPDVEFADYLVAGLLANETRYGYRACPCRLGAGKKEDDLDIICPCDYRDADLTQHGMCYCALYVSEAVARGKKALSGSIPERRPPLGERRDAKPGLSENAVSSLPLPVWRCRVCGYLCARENPPDICPVCKAAKDRFERFI